MNSDIMNIEIKNDEKLHYCDKYGALVKITENGLLEGNGKFLLSNGNYYIGSIKDSNLNGYGTMVNPKLFSYIGNFNDGKANGIGILMYKNKQHYHGEFVDGKANGKYIQED